MEENNKKIDEETTNEEKANNENLDKDCDCGCEHCGPDGCSEEDCKECDKDCDCKNEESKKSENYKKDEPEKDELTLANEKIKEWEDKYKRLLAEFDNFRKRSEKESAMMIDIGASMILTKILPIVDNFERALKTLPEEIKENSFEDGIDKIYKQILKTFEDLGVKPIEAVGKEFDPNLHNAVMTDDKEDAKVDTITEELQKGYTYKDQVLRHSMVKVKK